MRPAASTPSVGVPLPRWIAATRRSDLQQASLLQLGDGGIEMTPHAEWGTPRDRGPGVNDGR